MASSFNLPSFHGPVLHKSPFLGKAYISILPRNTCPTISKPQQNINVCPTAKFNLFEIMGGRGLCNGEEGLQRELEKKIQPDAFPLTTKDQGKSATSMVEKFPEDSFEKELLGFTGGFPGGEKGLLKFIENNPPPKKPEENELATAQFDKSLVKKPKPPELPLLMPGMVAIVKNPNSPYYMYCGIVQRITDGKAGVLFEGGNWDRLISFRLDELERREKGPPMVSPRSVVLETMIEKDS